MSETVDKKKGLKRKDCNKTPTINDDKKIKISSTLTKEQKIKRADEYIRGELWKSVFNQAKPEYLKNVQRIIQTVINKKDSDDNTDVGTVRPGRKEIIDFIIERSNPKHLIVMDKYLTVKLQPKQLTESTYKPKSNELIESIRSATNMVHELCKIISEYYTRGDIFMIDFNVVGYHTYLVQKYFGITHKPDDGCLNLVVETIPITQNLEKIIKAEEERDYQRRLNRYEQGKPSNQMDMRAKVLIKHFFNFVGTIIMIRYATSMKLAVIIREDIIGYKRSSQTFLCYKHLQDLRVSNLRCNDSYIQKVCICNRKGLCGTCKAEPKWWEIFDI